METTSTPQPEYIRFFSLQDVIWHILGQEYCKLHPVTAQKIREFAKN